MEWTRLVLTSLTFALLAFDSAWTFKYNSIAKYYSAHRRRCKEKSLEARETSADAVFTGTIQNLISDRRNPDTKIANVEIKRVIKGSEVLLRGRRSFNGVGQRPRVLVAGIGDRDICNSEARKYDTRIFLVSRSNIGQLRLNSSLVRISLSNIERTEAAVNGGQHPYSSTYNRSPKGAANAGMYSRSRSYASVDDNIIRIMPPASTSTPNWYMITTSPPTRFNTSTTTPSFRQSDTRTTDDPSWWQGSSPNEVECVRNLCLFGARCFVDLLTNTKKCRCGYSCPADTVPGPVCGSDSETYPSECHLHNASCMQQKPIAVHSVGPCEKYMVDIVTTEATTESSISETTTERSDPCMSHRCLLGARCVPASDSRSATCRCDFRCDDDRDSSVCGEDGNDYPSECHLRQANCLHLTRVAIKYNGSCDPCAGVECSVGQVCQTDAETRRPVCRCGGTGPGGVCPMMYLPVCASDGLTYSNECMMRVSACKRRRTDIRTLFRDECSAGYNPCSGAVCVSIGQQCHVTSKGGARCRCEPPCPPLMKPVCGSDRQTYDTECHLRRHACENRTPITVRHHRPCNVTGRRGDPCTRKRCQPGEACVVDEGQARCLCPYCSSQMDPVCGSDHVTYENECHLRSLNCANRRNVTVLHQGPCNACEEETCLFYSNCQTDENGQAQCVCPTSCLKVENKVCGTDGQTYMNECELQIKSCSRQQPIGVASRGSCDVCVGVKCRYGARCDRGRCVCPSDCPDPDPAVSVCGSNGRTYPSACALRRDACKNDAEITVVDDGACVDAGSGSGASGSWCDSTVCQVNGGRCEVNKDGSSYCDCEFNCEAIRWPVCGSDGKSYGNACQMKEEACRNQVILEQRPMDYCEDIEEELCDGNPALINPRTGLEYNCNTGQDKCPAGSYCHRLVNVARCCQQDEPIKSCDDTTFGCCPDGATAALGHDNAGCPGVCQCKLLGSYGLTCNPATRQCTCKPGVGGLQCDRCEPNYWGLPKIADGNSGCLPCNCNKLGSLREDCEQMTGRCTCHPGVTGQKCNLCPNGKRLSPTGCTDVMLNDYLVDARACSERRCRYGAMCQLTNGVAECVCPATCQDIRDPSVLDGDGSLVCGSDSRTYGSACQLVLFACRLQRDIKVAHYGPCQESSSQRETSSVTPVLTSKSRRFSSTRIRSTKHHASSADVAAPILGLIGDFCMDDADCYVANSNCISSRCECIDEMTADDDNTACAAKGRSVPSFSGSSYMLLRQVHYVSRDVSVVMRFKPLRPDGLLLYTAQYQDGRGDFLSLSLRHGYVEFRYDLGSGAALIRSADKLQLNRFHTLVARRFRRDGVLRVDAGGEVSGTSRGMLRALNVMTPFYVGYLPNATAHAWKDVGVKVGFVGCIESLQINSSQTTVTFDLTDDSSHNVLHKVNIGECGRSVCADDPCMHGGTCIPDNDDDGDFTCQCTDEYSGVLCEMDARPTSPCDPNPCHAGGTCIGLASGEFLCRCTVDRDGERCQHYDTEASSSTSSQPISVPQFHGDSFIVVPLKRPPSRSLSFEVWFLTFEPNGVLVYSHQEGVENGDFIVLNVVDERLQLRYNLGSGAANITSSERVQLNAWNKAVVSRKNQLGLLTLNDALPVRGRSPGSLRELNLPQRLYLGGYPGGIYHPDSDVTAGLLGAVQRFSVDGVLVEELVSGTVDHHHVTEYDGRPCPLQRGPCRHGGRCVPRLNNFDCQCTAGFTGRFCQTPTSSEQRSIGFNGRTYHRYKNSINFVERSQASNRYEVRFRADTDRGLMLLQHRSTSMHADFLAIAVNNAHLEVSLNLGKERSWDVRVLLSKVNVSDGEWHTLALARDKRIAHLMVDDDLVTGVSTVGATTLDTDGHLWIGGSITPPRGLSDAYYVGFRGCIEYVRVNDRPLDLISDRTSHDQIVFCRSI